MNSFNKIKLFLPSTILTRILWDATSRVEGFRDLSSLYKHTTTWKKEKVRCRWQLIFYNTFVRADIQKPGTRNTKVCSRQLLSYNLQVLMLWRLFKFGSSDVFDSYTTLYRKATQPWEFCPLLIININIWFMHAIKSYSIFSSRQTGRQMHILCPNMCRQDLFQQWNLYLSLHYLH